MTDVEIRRAVLDDIDGILALQEENLPERGGMLSAGLPREWLVAALAEMPIIVALRGNNVVGYLVSASRARVASVPVIVSMLKAYPGAPDAYVYGPVCVAAEERGRGLIAALLSTLRALLPRREGILFIRQDNQASLRAHERLGIQCVGEFNHNGTAFFVLAYQG